MPIGVDPDEHKFRRLGKQTFDLPAWDQTQQLKIGRFNYLSRPLGQRLVELLRDYVMGGEIGYRIRAENEKVQKVLENHWNDPWNDWNRNLPEMILNLSVDGELLVPVSVKNGKVLLGQIDPIYITRVENHPFKVSVATNVFVASEDAAQKEIPLKVISVDKDESEYRNGEVFFWNINKIPGGVRGVSDLFVLNDMIDQLDKFLYARARNAELRNAFVWDVTLAGAGESQIRKFREELIREPPQPGSTRVHSDTVQWSTVRSQVDSAQAQDEFQMFFNYILFGFGIPPTATGVGQASEGAIDEQMDILFKTFSSRGREVMYIIADVLDFVIDQAIISGELPKNIDREFRVITPRVAARDTMRMSTSLARIAEFFSAAGAMGIYGKEEMRRMINPYLATLGFDAPEKDTPPPPEDLPTPVQVPVGQPGNFAQPVNGGTPTNGATPKTVKPKPKATRNGTQKAAAKA